MFHKYFSNFLFSLIRVGLSICMVLAIILGLLPLGLAQADAAFAAAPMQAESLPGQAKKSPDRAKDADQGVVPEAVNADVKATYSPRMPERFLAQMDSSSFSKEFQEETPPFEPHGQTLMPESFMPKSGIEVSAEGTLPLPSSAGGGSLAAGIDTRALLGGITIDLTYDVVMGFVGAGETVSVTMGSDAYGVAVADGIGFFWTPLWHNTDGYQMDIACGVSISIVVGTDAPIGVVPPCVTGGIDIATDTIHATVSGDTGGTLIYAWLGLFDIGSWSGGLPPSSGSPYFADTTDTSGEFTLDFTGLADLGAESLIALDLETDLVNVNVRYYIYPDSPVFMVHQYHTIAGYAALGQNVTATVYEGAGPGVRWSDVTTASYPHGLYAFQEVTIEIGDTVEVILDGGPTLSTTVFELGNFNFDTGLNTIEGTAPEGKNIRATTWKWELDDYVYFELETTAATGNVFTMDCSSIGGLEYRDDFLIIVPDAVGNQVQITSGPPFVVAYISLDSNLDCVYGRLDGPGLPIVASVDKGGGEVYTRNTGYFTDAGNQTYYCFTVRDAFNDMIDFSTGDIVTLKDGTPGWAGYVEVVDFEWSGDTTTNSISGSSSDGEILVHVHQWQSGAYPEYGTASVELPVSGGSFGPFGFSSFDMRDGAMMELTHYDAMYGFATQTNNFSYWPTLPYFELHLPYGVGGLVSTPDEVVTASLYDTDGTTLLAQTSEDHSDAPYWYWLDDFGEYSLEPGYKVEVSMAGGWSGEMIVPDLSIAGDFATDLVTATGPQDLLFMEAYTNEYAVSHFVPGPNAILDTTYLAWDILQGETIAVTYQALDGNRARRESRLGEVYNVGTWLSPGSHDWIWGNALPGSTVTITAPTETIGVFADPECDGCWAASTPLEQGDLITVSAGDGVYPVSFSIADPFTAVADSTTEEISGQVGGWTDNWIEIYTGWDDNNTFVQTNSSGNYLWTFDDIPPGGNGNVYYYYVADDAQIESQLWFRAPDLLLDVFPSWNSIEGVYALGHNITLEVKDGGDNLKAIITIPVEEIWGSITGFNTAEHQNDWDPSPPEIVFGDKIYGYVDGEPTASAYVQVGAITGDVDVDTDSISGTIEAPWYYPDPGTVWVECHPWGAPEGGPSKWVEVTLDEFGEGNYYCEWDPDTEWDVETNQDIGVCLYDPMDHRVFNVFVGYSDELILKIHYDHEWIEGNYAPEHEINLTVYDSVMVEKAQITVPTGPIDDWGGQSGFATWLEGATWVPSHPDIQPGDVIHGEVDDGSEFTADVEVGTITGDPDMDTDSVSGTVDADWLLPGPIDVACSIWEENGPEVYDTVVPNGADTYECVFEGDNSYDIVPGTNLMVSYFDSAGHQIYGDFSPPAAHLRVEKWLVGQNVAEDGNAAFYIQYRNEGNASADSVTLTDTLVGMTYLRDTSKMPISGDDTEKTWDFGTVEPGDWIGFFLFAEVTASAGQDVSNTVEMSTSSPDIGDPGDRISIWEGSVAENDTYLSIGKDTWTWNPAPDQDFVYRVSVCNNGSTASSAVTLIDTLPDAVSLVTWWGDDPGWTEVDVSGNPLVLEHTCISSWSCSDVYFRVHLSDLAEPEDELINHAAISGGNDLSLDDNETELQHNVGDPYTDLAIWQDWHGGSLTPGGHYCYGMTFKNEGNVTVSGPIKVTASIPLGTYYASWDSWDYATVSEPVLTSGEVTWEVGDLNPGYWGTIQLCLDIDSSTLPSTTLNNSVEIAIQDGEENTENNHSELVETVRDHGPNLRVKKEGDWHGGQEGQSAWWNIQVENIGDQTIHDAVVVDTYPVGMELDGGINVNFWEWWDWWDDDPVEGKFTVQFDRLEPGWGVSIDYNTYVREDVALVPLMEFTNYVEVPLEADIEPVNNTFEYVLVYIGPRPYLRIEKWLIGENVTEGGNAAFWVQYQNQGGLAAEEVTITDTLVGMTYLSDTSGFSTTAVPGDTEITWDVGTVDPGDWIWFILFAEVTAPVDDPISNTVHISTSTPYDEGDEGEKISIVERTVVENDTYLSVGKDTWTWNPAPGEDFVYRVSVCNNGFTGSTTVSLTETLPLNTTYVTWWSTESGWVEVNPPGATVELTHPCISAHSCSDVYIVVTVDPSADPGDELHNTATIFADNDLSTGDDTTDLYHNVGDPYTDLAVWHDWHGGSLVPGGHYRYGISIQNEGNVAVSGPIEVAATLPAGTSFAGWDYWDVDVSITDDVGPTLTWEVGDLISGAQGTIQVWVDIDTGTPPGTSLEHLAEIEEQSGEDYTENNSSTMTEMVNGNGANLRIRKDGGIHGHGDGHNAWYRLTVENIGDETVDDVVITDSYPVGMVLDGDIMVNFWESWERYLYSDHFDVILSRLEPGWNMQIDYNTVIPGTDPIEPGQIFENMAEVLPLDGDANPADNTASFAMATGPDMYVEKSLDSGTFLPGEEVVYLLTFGNKHQDNNWWWDMTGNAILTDTLPDGMSFVSAQMHWCESSEWCEVTPVIDGQTLTWELYPIGRSNWNEIYLTVAIDSDITETNPLINQVMIESDSPEDIDPYPDNNTSEFDPKVNLEAPAITSANKTTFTEGSKGTFKITTTGCPDPKVTYKEKLPTGVTLVDNGDGTATLQGTPAEGTEGVYVLTLTASNGVLPNATQIFTLTIESVGFSTFLPLITH